MRVATVVLRVMVGSSCVVVARAQISRPADEAAGIVAERSSSDGIGARVPAAALLEGFRHLVRSESWTEVWPNQNGGAQTTPVTGEIWNGAIQAALDKHKAVYIPARERPYYLDGPLVLRSGCRLVADPMAEFRLKPQTATCMVRNEKLIDGQAGPVSLTEPDADILVQGGIWTTLATTPQESNGNARGRADARNSIVGAHGVFVFINVRGLQIRDVTVRQSIAFGVHLSVCEDFVVEGVTFEDHRRDGVHINGPARRGVVRRIRGVTHDDFVALNAWDWRNSSPAFGPIERVTVEDVEFGDQGGSDSIRLLPGTKRFPDGRTLDCFIRDCVFRDVRRIRYFKLYDQPNLEIGRDNDFSDPIGNLGNLRFEKVSFPSLPPEAPFQIHANTDGICISDVRLGFDPFAGSPPFRLVSIGPMSATFKHNPAAPNTWVEIFSPDKDCTVRNLRLENVSMVGAGGLALRRLTTEEAERLVGVVQQQLNPDYPRSTPRGGTGRGVWVNP